MTRHGVGYLGAALLGLGAFMPIVSMPIVGSLNYFQNGKGDGTIVLVLAIVSAIAIAGGHFRALWFTGISAIALLTFTLVNFRLKMSEARNEMRSDLEGNPFGGLAEAMIDTVQLQWGWGVLLLGAILLIVAARMSDARPGKGYHS